MSCGAVGDHGSDRATVLSGSQRRSATHGAGRRQVGGVLLLMLALVAGACSAAPVSPSGGAPAPVAWEDWRPGEPVRDLPRLAESDKFAMRKEHLASLAASYGIDDPPEVELERWIYPTEHGPTHEECFAEAGFEVEGGPEGEGVRVVGAVNAAQSDLLNRTHYTCTARFFIDPEFTQWPTPDQMRVTYEY